jgi:hypothetical protein
LASLHACHQTSRLDDRKRALPQYLARYLTGMEVGVAAAFAGELQHGSTFLAAFAGELNNAINLYRGGLGLPSVCNSTVLGQSANNTAVLCVSGRRG